MNPYELARASASALQGRVGGRPRVGMVLGSGLGGFADRLEGLRKFPYAELPGFHVPTVSGHAGNLCFGRCAGIEVAALQGRIHYYEGHDVHTVVHPVRVLAELGIRILIVTNAAGGIRADLCPGDLLLLSDHINLMGVNPLRGENDERAGPRFVDMTQAYDERLREAARAAASARWIVLLEGVYAALPGPSYETPAEIRYLRAIGADAVGMSTVPEVLAARHRGVRVVGVSCITNRAAGLSARPLSHAEVEETALEARERFQALLTGILEEIARMEDEP